MKTYRIFSIGLIAMLAAMPVAAGKVSIPNTFTTPQSVTPAKLNSNFTAVKTAVDANLLRLKAVETQVRETGAVSVSAHAFNDFADNDSCDFRRNLNYGYFDETGTVCAAVAPVALPHGATITGVSCLVYDSETTPNIYPASLRRASLAADVENEEIFSTPGTSPDSGSAQIFNAEDVGDEVVNNNNYAYHLVVTFNSADLITLTNLRLYNCKVSYTLVEPAA